MNRYVPAAVRKRYFLVPVFFSLFHYSCNQEKPQNDFDPNGPRVTEARGTVVPQDSTIPAELIPVRNEKKIRAGKPKIIPAIKNKTAAGQPLVLPAGTPKKFTPGKESIRNPVVVEAIGKPFLPSLPEMVPAKDAYIKDDDPENFSSFKILQGLKQPLICSMMQDKDGNLWFGTYSGGVSKYDGKYFTNYTSSQGLSNDGVWSMIQDRNGTIWFGTYGGGISMYDGKSFTNFNIDGGVGKNVVRAILQDKAGDLWFGTSNGVTNFNGKSFTHYTTVQGLCNDLVYCMTEDRNGNIWFGTAGGVSRFDKTSFANYTTAQGLGNDSVLSMKEDRSGNLWFGTHKGVTKYDGKTFSSYSVSRGSGNEDVNSIMEDRTGNLWLATSGGIIKFEGGSFTRYTTSQGLSNNKVTCMLEDKAGNLWFGTNGGGAARYDGRTFTHLTTAQGLCHNEVMRTVEDKDGNLWFATWGGGISKYDGNSFTNYSITEGLSHNNVFSILLARDGILWFGTGRGITRFDGTYFTNYTAEQGFSNDEVWSISQDKNGLIWFGTFGGGVISYDGKSFAHYSTKQGLSGGIVMCIMQDKNNTMWFGTYGGGLNKYDGRTFTHFTRDNGLSSNEVMDILQDKNGTIWIGTIGGGINKYNGKDFTNFNTTQGLSNEIVMGILEDPNGTLWISTRNGLNRLMKHAHSYATKENDTIHPVESPWFKNYLFADGFLGVNCYVNSIFRDSRGNIWLGTGDRLTCFHPDREIPDTIPPNIQLSNVALFNENINWLNLENKKDTSFILGNGVNVGNIKFSGLSKWYNVPENLNLSYSNNYLTFKFIGITTKSPYKVRYRYKLDGLDQNWSSISDRTEAPYGNLPHGQYTFRVKAMNSEGFWSPELKYAFVIRPPWWQTWWFRLSALAVTVYLLYSFYRFRLNQVLRLQVIRNKIASDLHDDIGSTLNSISIYSEVARQDAAMHEHALSMIGESSRKIIDAMSDIVWTINPENDNFENIILRMRSLTYNLMRAKNIEHTFHANELLNSRNLSMEDRRNFYLIFKEALNNMVKYSGATKAQILLMEEKNRIKLTVRDNGIGFDTTLQSNGNGLKNMRIRAEEMKALLKIESEKGSGTNIELTLPV